MKSTQILRRIVSPAKVCLQESKLIQSTMSMRTHRAHNTRGIYQGEWQLGRRRERVVPACVYCGPCRPLCFAAASLSRAACSFSGATCSFARACVAPTPAAGRAQGGVLRTSWGREGLGLRVSLRRGSCHCVWRGFVRPPPPHLCRLHLPRSPPLAYDVSGLRTLSSWQLPAAAPLVKLCRPPRALPRGLPRP